MAELQVELEDTAKKMGLSTHAGFSGNGERAGKNKFKLLIIGPGADSVIRPITAGLSLLHY
jgi:peptidyl-tRNA hydrolase